MSFEQNPDPRRQNSLSQNQTPRPIPPAGQPQQRRQGNLGGNPQYWQQQQQRVPVYQPPVQRRKPWGLFIFLGVVCVALLCCGAFFLGSRLSGGFDLPFSDLDFSDNSASVQSTSGKEHSGNNHLPTVTDPAEITEEVEISIIAAQYGSKSADWWYSFEKDFEDAYPNVDLLIDVVSWNDIYIVVDTRISNNDAPDILNIDVFADYQADGLLLPAQDYISDETYEKFFPNFLEQSRINGTVWAVPDLASARAMYYNADILAAAGVEVPTTWAELEAACEAIKAYNPSIYPWGVDMTFDEGQACFAYYAMGNGGGFLDEYGNWDLNSPENAEAVEFIVGMAWSGLTNPNPAMENRYDLQEMFAAGKLAMMIGPNMISSYVASTENPINFGIAPIPTNNGNPSATLGVMDRMMCFDNDYSRSELAAITAFFDFFYEDRRYADWVTMEGFLPATTSGCEVMGREDPSSRPWLEILESAWFYPAAKAEWSDVKRGVIEVLQEAYLYGLDSQALLDSLQQNIAY